MCWKNLNNFRTTGLELNWSSWKRCQAPVDLFIPMSVVISALDSAKRNTAWSAQPKNSYRMKGLLHSDVTWPNLGSHFFFLLVRHKCIVVHSNLDLADKLSLISYDSFLCCSADIPPDSKSFLIYQGFSTEFSNSHSSLSNRNLNFHLN